MNRSFCFISGLPRSGSTLIANLMAQHPDCHVTPTSACHESLFVVRNHWFEWTEHKADKKASDPKNLGRVLKAMLESYHDTDKPVIIDKARSWLSSIEMVEFALGHPIKIIVPVRNISEILASFEGLYRKNSHLKNVPGEYLASQTTEGRCAHWAGSTGEVGIAYNRLKDVIQRGLGDRLLFVEFDNLTFNPEETMKQIWKFLDMEPCKHDFESVQQVTIEDDTVYGYKGMHDIRQSVSPVQHKAHKIIGQQVANKYANAEFWRS